MSFAIEVPGDANPLSLQSLYQTLQSATSTDYAQRQTAGQQLTSWELQPGYYSSLQVSLTSITASLFTDADQLLGRLSRQITCLRSSIPCDYSTQEWYRSILAVI